MGIVDTINNLVKYLTDTMSSLGPFSGVVLVILESILPFLPLSVFIALNGASFGYVLGFIISWISTCIGCVISFFVFRKLFQKRFNRFISNRDKEAIKRIKKRFDNIKLSTLVLIVALPFTPAFAVNIAAGLSKMSFKKFLMAILIGKLSIVYFWTYIGKSLIESMMDIKAVITVSILLIISYIVSKLINKKLRIE